MVCAAAGVAERVAAERGETVGGTVGYQIRLERRASEHTKLLFVTTGILLRRLQADPQLEGVTHVILDEVCMCVWYVLCMYVCTSKLCMQNTNVLLI